MTNFMQHFIHKSFCRLFSVFASLVFIVLSGPFSFAVTLDRVLASVDNEIITYADYKQFVKGLGEAEQGEEVNTGVLNRLIEDKIILSEAKRKGIEVSDEEVDKEVEELRTRNGLSGEGFEALLAEDNLDITVYRTFLKDKMTVSKLVTREVNAMVVVTEREMKRYYDENKKDHLASPETVELKAIFLKLKEDATITEMTDLKIKALKIASQLRSGESFERLMEEYSDGPVKSHEGILGKFARGKLIPPLDHAAFSLKEGEISDPVWVSDGAYILKLVHKTGESFQPFESVKEEIYSRLFLEKREKLFTEWVKKLWEQSSVKIN